MNKILRRAARSTAAVIATVAIASAHAGVVNLDPSTVTATEGETFDVAVIARAFDELAGGTVDLSYTAGVVDVVSVTIDERWDFEPSPGRSAGAGRWDEIAFDVFGNEPLNGNGTIATITFRAAAVGEADIEIAAASQFFSTLELLELDELPNGATVTVAAVPLPAALVLFGSAIGLLGWLSPSKRRKI